VKPVPSEGTIGATSKGSAHLPGNGFAGFSGSWDLGLAGRCAGCERCQKVSWILPSANGELQPATSIIIPVDCDGGV